jgi:serine/threonine protein phosphatase 1
VELRRFVPDIEMPNGISPSTPKGLRVYAIGDVHGCLDKLESLAWQIKVDSKDALGEVQIVLLGDYVDRGPQSRETIDYLIAAQRDWAWQLLLGNHDKDLPINTVPDGGIVHWCTYGGRETLASYGIDVSMLNDEELEQRSDELLSMFRAAVPRSHEQFIASLKISLTLGDYVFVHAGIRPGTKLLDQTEEDMLFIRNPFLQSDEDHRFVVVHGHTPVEQIEVLSNRIGIDTGAVFGGRLTALAMEGTKRWFLQC